jgi:predicted CoA-binding protein
MNSQKTIGEFLAQHSFAVVGVSRHSKKFGNQIYKMLKEKGKEVFPINSFADHVEGDRCYPGLHALPKKVDGVVVVVPPKEAEHVVKEAAGLGIRRIWMQQGSESRSAIQYCEQYGLDIVHGECIFMYAEPVVSFHKFHRFMRQVFGRMPRA